MISESLSNRICKERTRVYLCLIKHKQGHKSEVIMKYSLVVSSNILPSVNVSFKVAPSCDKAEGSLLSLRLFSSAYIFRLSAIEKSCATGVPSRALLSVFFSRAVQRKRSPLYFSYKENKNTRHAFSPAGRITMHEIDT